MYRGALAGHAFFLLALAARRDGERATGGARSPQLQIRMAVNKVFALRDLLTEYAHGAITGPGVGQKVCPRRFGGKLGAFRDMNSGESQRSI
jgi:hypothetical protein